MGLGLSLSLSLSLDREPKPEPEVERELERDGAAGVCAKAKSAALRPAPMAATYSFDAETSVATIAINDGKMNAFGFDMMAAVNAALDAAEADVPKGSGALLAPFRRVDRIDVPRARSFVDCRLSDWNQAAGSRSLSAAVANRHTHHRPF